MANITVHLTLSGMIILQPVVGVSPYDWRILVPDFSGHSQKHVAFVAVDKAELQPPGQGYAVAPLAGMKVHINDVKAPGGPVKMPDEVLDLRETCDPLTPGCAKIRTAAELMAAGETPALELFVANAKISATGVDQTLPWFFDWGGGKTKPKKGPNAWVAEEVCLTFTTDEPTFKIDFTHGASPLSFELAPVANDRVEIAIRNVGIPHHSGHHKIDPHFPMYYGVMKTPPNGRPDLANAKSTGGKRTNPHKHRLRLIKEDGTVGEEPVLQAKGAATQRTAANLGLLDVFILSMTGSNCPPGTGDPYP